MITTILISILAYLLVGWLTVPFIEIFLDYVDEYTLGDLFKFTDPFWYAMIFLWPVVWIIVLIIFCDMLSISEIVIWKRRKKK